MFLKKSVSQQFSFLAGLTACLFWNIIAVTAAWIKGEGVDEIWFFPMIDIVNLCSESCYTSM